MATEIPSNVGYGHVVGRFIRAVADTLDDPDRNPDGLGADLEITFKPSPKWLLNHTASPDPTTIMPDEIVCTTDEDGYLIDPTGAQGVYLVATDDPDNNPTGWTYTVDIAQAGTRRTIRSFEIEVPANGTVDLTTVSPVAGSPGNSIVRGDPAKITIGTTTTGAAGTSASVSNSGTPEDAILDFTIPRGAVPTVSVGDVDVVPYASGPSVTNSGTPEAAVFDFEIPAGPAATVSVHSTATGAVGTPASVTNEGDSSNANLKFTIPTGPKGEAATVAVGNVSTVDWDKSADVSNSGTTAAAVLDFEIPRGKAATVDVDSTVTSAAGTSANVINTGTANDAKFKFTIPKGDKGETGNAATVAVGDVTTVGPSDPADVTNSGTQYAAVLDFDIPKGEKGDAATVAIDSTVTGAAGTSASVTNTGDSHDAKFKFTIPKGDKGDTGNAATVAVGDVTTVGPSDPADVTNSGTQYAAVLDFDIPKGEKGDAATVDVDSTVTGAAGTPANVVNTGDSHDAKFKFTIPKGDKGDTGTAATISVDSTVTGAAGTSASVTNEGTSSAASLKFTIPRGDRGINWKGTWSSGGTYSAGDAIERNGSSYFCTQDVGPTATAPENDGAHWELMAQRGVDGSGSVVSINSIGPDLSGDVALAPGDIGAQPVGSYAAASHSHSWSEVTGKPAVIAAGATQAAARTAIGAGTSSLTLGSTSSTAMPGNKTAVDLGGAPSGHTHAYNDLTGKPSIPSTPGDIGAQPAGSYAAASHAHPASQISDSTATGRNVLTAANAPAARSAIGAGTSDLAIGLTGSTAMAGDTAVVKYTGAIAPYVQILTQAQYDAIVSPDPATLYVVKDS